MMKIFLKESDEFWQSLKFDIFGLQISLEGEIGSGKTSLVRFFLRSLGYNEPVRSPTYTICEHYKIGNRDIVHVDAYRIENEDDFYMLGLESHDTIFIEWASLHNFLKEKIDIKINIDLTDDPLKRLYTIEALSEKGKVFLSKAKHLRL